MRILVAGSAGFLGSHLCERLLLLNHQVIGIDNYCYTYDPIIKINRTAKLKKHRNFSFYETDITNPFSIDKLFKEISDIDILINLASHEDKKKGQQDPRDVITTNVIGNTNLLDAVKDMKIKKYILGSASGVYGDTKKIPFLEKHAYTKPVNVYAASKSAAETVTEVYSNQYNFPAIIFRFFSVYGPSMPPDMGLYRFIDSAYKNSVIKNVHKNVSRDYVYVGDALDAIVSSLNKRLTFQVINIASGKSYTNKEVISNLENILGKKIKIEYTKSPINEIAKTVGSTAKAKKMLNFVPSVNLQTGLYKTYQWYLSNNEYTEA